MELPVVRRSTTRDLGWGAVLVSITVWWVVLAWRYMNTSNASPAYDYMDNPCGQGSLASYSYLYYPAKQSMVQSLDDLRLTKGICVDHCPNKAEALHKGAAKNNNHLADASYPKYILESPLYATSRFSNFLCLPIDEPLLGQKLIELLKLNNSNIRAWVFVTSASQGGAFCILVVIMFWTLFATPTVMMTVAVLPNVLPLLCLLVTPTLGALLILISSKMDTYQDYSRQIMAQGITLSSFLCWFVTCGCIVTGIAVYRNRQRLDLSNHILQVEMKAASSIPGIWLVPIVGAVLICITAGVSLKLSSSLILSDDNHKVSYDHPAFQNFPVDIRPRQLMRVTDSWAAQFETAIDNIHEPDIEARPAKVQGLHFQVEPNPSGNIDILMQQPQRNDVDAMKTHPEIDKDNYTANEIKQSINNVKLRTRWMATTVVTLYMFCAVVIMEWIVATSNMFVSAWTIVWYYSTPNLGDERVVELAAVRYASGAVLSNHLASIVLIGCLNSIFRCVTVPITCLMYISAIAEFYNRRISRGNDQVSHIGRTLAKLHLCCSPAAVAFGLLQGSHVIESTEIIANEDIQSECFAKVLRFSALSVATTIELLIPIMSAVIISSICTIIPAVNSEKTRFFVEAPMLTTVIGFIITFYVCLAYSSALTHAAECIICCYIHDRKRGTITSFTPDELTMIYSDVRSAAVEWINLLEGPNISDIDESPLYRAKVTQQIGYETDAASESSVMFRPCVEKENLFTQDAVSYYVKGSEGKNSTSEV